ncbi:ABC transporter permease [Nocardiopsis sp. NPDC058631]|uniref:ABC transporter permease n=1 Tax=Nocardiopsis sp. NPDC058631 TaxID=3346566 RepID=UPI0036483107
MAHKEDRRRQSIFIDGMAITMRELRHLRHQPVLLLGEVVFAVLFVVLFGYVFGSAISVPGGGDYREFLMPALFAVTVFFGVTTTTEEVARDVERGVMDRFRSMPMSRIAVPLGRTTADMLVSIPALVVMVGVGLVVGWRPHEGLAPALAAFALVILLGYAMRWVGVVVGLYVTPATASIVVRLVLPLAVLSNAFVPTEGMPPVLRTIAEWNPLSSLITACRELFGNPVGTAADASWPLQNPVIATVVWSLLILLVFVPVAVARFRKPER